MGVCCMANDVLFRTAAFGGFKKDDVMSFVERILSEKNELEKQLAANAEQIVKLNEQISQMQSDSDEVERLRSENGELSAKIDEYEHIDPRTHFHAGISDPKAFIFTFRNNNPLKFDIMYDKRNDSTFILCKNDLKPLFAFGACRIYEIWVGKEGVKSYCYNRYTGLEPNFDISDNPKILTGYAGCYNQFEIKRVLVIQFKE